MIRYWTVLGLMAIAMACSVNAQPPTGSPPTTGIGDDAASAQEATDAEAAHPSPASTEPAQTTTPAADTTQATGSGPSSTGTPATTRMASETARVGWDTNDGRLVRMGVVLVDPSDSLNMRSGPGVGNPIVATLHYSQTDLVPTGSSVLVDGSPWHEIAVGDMSGWVHGRYITEQWHAGDVLWRWDWRTALDRFAEALETGTGLSDTVTWRGFYASDSVVVHWWPPREVDGLVTDGSGLRWYVGEIDWEDLVAIGHVPTFAEAVAEPFLSVYSDPQAAVTVGGLPAVGYAIPQVFANFPWVAIHDPSQTDMFDFDWATTFVFLELGDDDPLVPRVVGIHTMYWSPNGWSHEYLQQLQIVRALYADS